VPFGLSFEGIFGRSLPLSGLAVVPELSLGAFLRGRATVWLPGLSCAQIPPRRLSAPAIAKIQILLRVFIRAHFQLQSYAKSMIGETVGAG
jgi:hypothetical protein